MSVPDYYNRANPDLLKLIPRNAESVVEIGCGAGALGRLFKTYNPFTTYMGMELDLDACKVAEERLDKAIVANAEETSLKKLGVKKGSTDCIIYGDVLEHLNDPWALLREHREYLSDDGMVLACIPNIGHWSILHGLMQGKWKYQDEGLLDRTHLRFFTMETIEDMFTQCGFHVVDVQSRQVQNENHEKFVRAMLPALKSLGIDGRQFAQNCGSFQYVVRATKNATTQKPMLLQSVMLKPVAACNDVRITEPHSFVGTIPGVRLEHSVADIRLHQTTDDPAKVLVWQRPLLRKPHDFERVRKLVEFGYLVVLEFDDSPVVFPRIEEHDNFTFKGVHAIQTTNEELANIFRQYNPNVGVFPNQIAQIPPRRDYAKEPDYATLFFGALNREKESSKIVPIVNKMLKKYPDTRVQVVHDKAFFEALETEHKQFEPLCDYAQYRKLLYGSSIALMPLQFDDFSRMKSDLKFIEAAAHGVAALASPTVYENTVKEGETGMLFHSFEECEQKLDTLLADKGLRVKMAEAAYTYVKDNRLLCQHYQARYDWYMQMHAKLPELTQQLRERCPEVFAEEALTTAA